MRGLLPDTRSQVACVFTALLAIALSVYWLIFTIRQKWIYGQQHPQQLVSYETVASLLSFFGLGFWDPHFGASASSYFAVLPSWSGGNSKYDGFRCYNSSAVLYEFCVPADANGQPILDPQRAPAGEVDGASAGSISLSEFQQWPQQFTPFSGGISFLVFLLSEDSTKENFDPYINLFAASPQQTLAMLETSTNPETSLHGLKAESF
jgi:hypothetical protein